MEHELNLPGLAVWAGISSAGLTGPSFFDTTANVERYLQMLKEQFLPATAHFNLNNLYFQQDEAPAHYGAHVTERLDTAFPNQWIGKRGLIE